MTDFVCRLCRRADDPVLTSARSLRMGRLGHCRGVAGGSSELMLDAFPDVHHVYLSSGACLPLRPVAELIDYPRRPAPRRLHRKRPPPPKSVGPLAGWIRKRFTLRFPFSWRRNRKLFDTYVKLQRATGLRRRIPDGLVPHMGSQWWCLTRQTLSAILQDPRRRAYDRYFRRVWIPDESYFQTLARLYSTHIESRSLTLSKFDYQGRPHIFYDDHLQLLRQVRLLRGAENLAPGGSAVSILSDRPVRQRHAARRTQPRQDRPGVFQGGGTAHKRGRDGLYMQSRFPRHGSENGLTSFPYSVFQGFAELFEDFEPWLAETTGTRVHGHLFGPDRAAFAGGETIINGALSDCAVLRDYNPTAFVSNLIWNTRGERQCFQFGPGDNSGNQLVSGPR